MTVSNFIVGEKIEKKMEKADRHRQFYNKLKLKFFYYIFFFSFKRNQLTREKKTFRLKLIDYLLATQNFSHLKNSIQLKVNDGGEFARQCF